MRAVEYESVPCPHCASDDCTVFIPGCELDSSRSYRRFEGFEKLNYVICRACRLIYANPRLRYDDETLNALFPNHVKNKARRRLSRRHTLPARSRRTVGRVADLLGARRGDFLEIGCGFGDAIKAAEELGFRAVGTELYEDFIEGCRELGLDVRPGSVDGIPFQDASFDVVYMEDVLEHLTNPFAYIDEAARVLRPGGVLFVHTWTIGNPTNVVEAFGADWRANRNLDLTAHTTIFPRELLKAFLVGRGLSIRRGDLLSELDDRAKDPGGDSHFQIWDFYCKKGGEPCARVGRRSRPPGHE